MILSILAVVIGLVILVWSADKFVEGAVGVARFCGMSTLLIGMIVVGFGTSAPELVVSILSAIEGSPEIALGNVYGSNIANVALILGATALISPIIIQKKILKRDLPVLIIVSLIAAYQLLDGSISRLDAVILLVLFTCVMGSNVFAELKAKKNQKEEIQEEVSLKKSLLWLILGLLLLVGSSRLLVWGAIQIAQALGVSDLVIGLTIVAIGTSLPELASSIVAAKKGEHDLAVGNIIGSNMFNILLVIGVAGVVAPMHSFDASIISRDMPLMLLLIFFLFLFGIPRKNKEGVKVSRLNRVQGGIYLVIYAAYLVLLVVQSFGQMQ